MHVEIQSLPAFINAGLAMKFEKINFLTHNSMEPKATDFHGPMTGLNTYRAILGTLKPKKAAEFKEALYLEHRANKKQGHEYILTSDILRVAKRLKIRIAKGI